MTSLQKVVSLILFAVGGLLALLGLMSLLVSPPPDVSPEISRGVNQAFVTGGVFGIGLVGLGVYVRTRRVGGGVMTGLWVAYVLFWLMLAGLVAFVWRDLANLVAVGDAVVIVVYLIAFLGAPVIELFARRRRRGRETGPASPLSR